MGPGQLLGGNVGQLTLLDVPPQAAPEPTEDERYERHRLDLAGRAHVRLRKRERAERERKADR
jgi:hypothetical protein